MSFPRFDAFEEMSLSELLRMFVNNCRFSEEEKRAFYERIDRAEEEGDEVTKEEIENIFSYHKPNQSQVPKYEAIREGAKAFAKVVIENCPSSADRSAAIRLLRECVMTANASIALDVTAPEPPEGSR